jgi:adenylylsulfate kinase-like enzyme
LIRVAALEVAVYQVHLTAPIEVLRARDKDGLYRAQAEGRLSGLTGVDAPYEPPAQDEALCLDTSKLSVDECVKEILDFVKKRPPKEW